MPLPAALRELAGARAGELLRELRAEAARAPAPLKAIWGVLADALGAQQRRAIDRQMTSGIGELAQACRRITADRYPFARDSKSDMPYADFARLFGPRGLLDSFYRAHLASQVDAQRRPWRLVGSASASPKAQSALRSFEMADDIRRLFFPADVELPQLRLRLTPLSMDGELLQFSADVDGQLMRYENGPRRPKAVQWPGPAATQRVLLRILPAGPSGVGAEAHEGPWALLRVLLAQRMATRGRWRCRAGGAAGGRWPCAERGGCERDAGQRRAARRSGQLPLPRGLVMDQVTNRRTCSFRAPSAWYGKLPSRGDFVSRGVPRSWSRPWDEWLQRSLALAAQRLGASRLARTAACDAAVGLRVRAGARGRTDVAGRGGRVVRPGRAHLPDAARRGLRRSGAVRDVGAGAARPRAASLPTG